MNARVNQIGAIIFANNDLTANVQSAIQRQLEITDTMDGYELNQRILANPNYPAIIHNTPLRILVIRSFNDYTNRALADIAIFVKAGLAYVEGGLNGPPATAFQVDRMQLDKVLVAQMAAISGPGTPALNPNVQSNVLYPLFDNDYSGYPFASEPINSVDDDDGDDEDDEDEDFITG